MTNYTTNYLSKGQFRAAKARLTRAINSGNPHTVKEVVAETFAEWDRGNYAYPDDWHRWERASQDADFAILRAS
jgi:hypothetical protein